MPANGTMPRQKGNRMTIRYLHTMCRVKDLDKTMDFFRLPTNRVVELGSQVEI